MAPRKDIAASATYGDYEVITPENKLRNAVSMRPPISGEEDPVARAEQALSTLPFEFESWMDSECNRLDQARRSIGENGFTTTNTEAPPMTSKARPRPLVIWPWPQPPTACAG
jgi:hypothetical protein